VDFSCLKIDEEKIFDALKTISGRYSTRLIHIDDIDNGIGCYHYIYIEDNEKDGITGDIALRRLEDTKLIDPSSDREHTEKISVNYDDVFPLSTLQVRDMNFPVPKKSREILIKYYGEKGLTVPDRLDHA